MTHYSEYRAGWIVAVAFVASAFSDPAFAARPVYAVTGPHTGSVCVLGVACHMEPINAVRRPDGHFFEMPTSYPSVSEYNEQTKRCFIRTDRGLVAKLVSNVRNDLPTFYFRTAGKAPKRMSPEYVSFPCLRR